MTKKIVYIHPGDMIEVRMCSPEFEATATGWKESTRPSYKTIRFARSDELEVFDPIGTMVFAGTGDNRRQMLVKA